MVAERIVLLDYQTRSGAIFGFGPGPPPQAPVSCSASASGPAITDRADEKTLKPNAPDWLRSVVPYRHGLLLGVPDTRLLAPQDNHDIVVLELVGPADVAEMGDFRTGMRPTLMSAARRATTITPGLSARDQRDHDHRNR
jgi:hypothetical protein